MPIVPLSGRKPELSPLSLIRLVVLPPLPMKIAIQVKL